MPWFATQAIVTMPLSTGSNSICHGPLATPAIDVGSWPLTRRSAASSPRIGSLKNRRTRSSPRTVLPGGGRMVTSVGGMSSTMRYWCVAAAVAASIRLGGRAVSAMP